MNEELIATLSVERELKNEFQIIEYECGNGDVHFHSQIELCIVEEGCVDALVDNRAQTLRKGDAAISLCYNSHRYISKGCAKYSVLILPHDICEKFYGAAGTKTLVNPFVCCSPQNNQLLEYLSLIKENLSNALKRQGYLFLLLGLLLQELHTEPSDRDTGGELLSRLLLYVQENYKKDITLRSIAKHFGYHPGYISAYFKNHLDLGLSRYIRIIRLKNAVQLLHQNQHSIAWIALECGFNSTRTFYRAFQSEFQCSPKEYLHNM